MVWLGPGILNLQKPSAAILPSVFETVFRAETQNKSTLFVFSVRLLLTNGTKSKARMISVAVGDPKHRFLCNENIHIFSTPLEISVLVKKRKKPKKLQKKNMNARAMGRVKIKFFFFPYLLPVPIFAFPSKKLHTSLLDRSKNERTGGKKK